MKFLILGLSLMVSSNALGEEEVNKSAAFAYGGTAHILTEASIKTMNAVMNENKLSVYSNSDPSGWNHMFSSVLVFSVLANTATSQDHTSEQKTLNVIGIATGILTGNLFQIEW
jgi:hypothetical protein